MLNKKFIVFNTVMTGKEFANDMGFDDEQAIKHLREMLMKGSAIYATEVTENIKEPDLVRDFNNIEQRVPKDAGDTLDVNEFIAMAPGQNGTNMYIEYSTFPNEKVHELLTELDNRLRYNVDFFVDKATETISFGELNPTEIKFVVALDKRLYRKYEQQQESLVEAVTTHAVDTVGNLLEGIIKSGVTVGAIIGNRAVAGGRNVGYHIKQNNSTHLLKNNVRGAVNEVSSMTHKTSSIKFR